MGVAGSGKTTVGAQLADRLGALFVDADSAHPPANIEKMASGTPLTDDDRRRWLRELRRRLDSSEDVVVTCSALRRSYRDVLRGSGGVSFVFLDVDPEAALERLNAREGHFMKADMVESQFGDLERPSPDELDVLTLDASQPVETLLDFLVTRFDP